MNSAVKGVAATGAGAGGGVGASRDARRDRWTAHRDARRREFVDAALRVLMTSGTDLPMEAVAAEAGVTKPVLYRYFSDKAALINALAERGTELLITRLLPAINSTGPALARTREAIGAYFAVIDENPNLYWLLARRPAVEWADGQDPVQQDKELVASALTAVIGDYLREFGLDSGAAEPWAYGVTGLVQSTGEWWLQRRSMSRVHVVEYTTRLVWGAFAGVLRDQGITIDPDQPIPVPQPKLRAAE
jgi:AcrR family transcriptional regulator